MPDPIVHKSLTPIRNVRQSFIWTCLPNHRTWIRLNMHGRFFSVWFQLDLCSPGRYRSSWMHCLLNGGWFHNTEYRLWLRACAWDVVLQLMPIDVIRIVGQVYTTFITIWKFSLLESPVLRQIVGVPRRSLYPSVDALTFDVRITRIYEWCIFDHYASILDSIKSLIKILCCILNVIPIELWVVYVSENRKTIFKFTL